MKDLLKLFKQNVPVEDVLVRNREVYGVRTAQGDIRAGTVVNCAGMFSSRVASISASEFIPGFWNQPVAPMLFSTR